MKESAKTSWGATLLRQLNLIESVIYAVSTKRAVNIDFQPVAAKTFSLFTFLPTWEYRYLEGARNEIEK